MPAPVVSVTQSASVAAPVATMRTVDLSIAGVQVMDRGTADRGMRLRVKVANKGPMDLMDATRVAAFAANSGEPTGELPRSMAMLNGLAAGQTRDVEIDMPLSANGMPMLIAGVELPENYVDANEKDNVAQGPVDQLLGMQTAAN